MSECEQTFYYIYFETYCISGHPSSQCTHLNCSSLPPQPPNPPPPLKPRTSDRVLVLGEGFLGELDRVLDLVEGFLGELKLVLDLVEGFLEELKLVMSKQRFFKIVCFRFPTNVPKKIEHIRF